ncbi:hypothetical protein V9T40_008741 [Parthenolecanium corni]|uniref:Sulfatase N-terminal domain-containing protein n=1 Tax=Parthenolecanium corni TaxID=536013 RepID=A0AAN9TR96_9HEMI
MYVTYILLSVTFCGWCHASEKPHVIFIVADDLGWNDVGFHGSNQIPTPNIDALAYSGIILQNYYTLQLCTPSRSALMTGKHPIHTGMQHGVIIGGGPYGLPLDLKILPQYLNEDGYRSHAIGKWHLGHFKEKYTPTRRGFNSHFGYWTGRQDYYDHSIHEGDSWGYDMRRGMNVSWDSFGSYTTDLITGEAETIIKSHDPKTPLFLYVAHLAVHSANSYQYLEAPEEIIQKFDYIKDNNRKKFAAMLYKLDESVGRIITSLDEKGMLNNSLIVFTTDNGGPAGGYDNNAASNWPLRGTKNTLWEGGVRGAACIWSRNLPASKINNDIMHLQDWLPTILAAVNYTSSTKNLSFDGHNMWPVLKEEEKSMYDEILVNIDEIQNVTALRKGDWKIITGEFDNGIWDKRFGPSGRNSWYKYNITEIEASPVAIAFRRNYISFPSPQMINETRENTSLSCDWSQLNKACDLRNEICLFNVQTDPCERVNQAESRPEILKELLQALKKYKPVKPLNKPFDERSNPKYWNYTWTNWMDFV